MPRDYMPSNDEQFQVWLSNFCTELSSHLADFGMVAGDLGTLGADQSDFNTKLGDHQAKKIAAGQATVDKNNARIAVETDVRPIVRRINNHPAMTDGLRVALGLNVPGSGASTTGVGVEVPDLALEYLPGNVVVHFGTTPTNEQLNGKPAWAKGCNIYRKKEGESEYKLLDFATSSPYYDVIDGPAATYSYIVRYRGTKVTELGQGSIPGSISASGLMAA